MKKLISYLILFSMLITLVPFAVSAGDLKFESNGTISGIVWNFGYIGSSSNTSYTNKINSNGTYYNYTDVITVPSKGTKITFTDAQKGFASAAAYVISSWKLNAANAWELDTDGANYNGTSTGIYKDNGDTRVYTYITYKDNENIRLCYRSEATNGSIPSDVPTVNWSATTEASTFTPPTPADPASALDVKWNAGYAVISPCNGYGYSFGYASAGGFYTTDVFTVAKAGTKLTWTDPASGYAASSVLTVSSWKKENNEWIIDADGAMFTGNSGKKNFLTESAATSSGTNYTYVTSKDNENLRLCVIAADVKVSAVQTTEKGTWEKAQAFYQAEPGIPLSSVTGAAVDAAEYGKLKWNYGYVGSGTHSTAPNKISNGGNVYLYSDVFRIPKAGTTIYFYDDNITDGDSSQYASSNAYVVSHWKQSGSSWVVDTAKNNLNGDEVEQKMIGNYKLYRYTTTEDNENIRLCYRGGLADLTLVVHPYKIYVSNPIELVKQTETGKLTATSYKNSAGETVNYSIYLPSGYTEGEKRRVVFNIGENNDIVNALIADGTDAVIVSFNGTAKAAEQLIDAVIENYKLNKYFMYLIGSAEVNTDCGKAFVGYIADKTGYLSALEAGKALLDKAPKYYNVLEGVTMYAMGDSYFAGSGIGKPSTWVNMMGDKYGMTYENYGIGGSTVSDYVTNKNPMVVRFKNMQKGNADVILIEGGRNDRTNSVPLGKNDSTDSKTFLGALNIMINSCLETYPNAVIILVTPWYNTSPATTGLTNVTYANAMRDLAKFRNDSRVVCLYAADKNATGVNMDDSSFRTKYSIAANDVSHLNTEGMLMIQPYMEKFIAQALASYKGTDVNGDKLPDNPGNDETTTDSGNDTSTPDDDTTTAQDTTAPNTTGANPQSGSCTGCGGIAVAAQIFAVVCGSIALIITKKKH